MDKAQLREAHSNADAQVKLNNLHQQSACGLAIWDHTLVPHARHYVYWEFRWCVSSWGVWKVIFSASAHDLAYIWAHAHCPKMKPNGFLSVHSVRLKREHPGTDQRGLLISIFLWIRHCQLGITLFSSSAASLVCDRTRDPVSSDRLYS